MNRPEWHIYTGRIPFAEDCNFWVSFESDSKLTRTKSNIYNRCLPCIKSLYQQLKERLPAITLGTAYNCWKITAVLKNLEQCLNMLHEFERRFPGKYVYGKYGSGRPEAATRVVVFHAESTEERNWLCYAVKECLPYVGGTSVVHVSRACAVLYEDLLGDWQHWSPMTTIKHPEVVDKVVKRIRRILYTSAM